MSEYQGPGAEIIEWASAQELAGFTEALTSEETELAIATVSAQRVEMVRNAVGEALALRASELEASIRETKSQLRQAREIGTLIGRTPEVPIERVHLSSLANLPSATLQLNGLTSDDVWSNSERQRKIKFEALRDEIKERSEHANVGKIIPAKIARHLVYGTDLPSQYFIHKPGESVHFMGTGEDPEHWYEIVGAMSGFSYKAGYGLLELFVSLAKQQGTTSID